MPNVNKSQLIEIILPGVATTGNQQTKIQFNDQPYLRFKKVQGVEVLNSADMTLSPSNKTPISNAQMKAAYLTLYLNDPQNPANVGEWIQNVPFSLLHRIQNAATDPFIRSMFNLNDQVIYWEKCYISLPVAYANTTDVSFLIQVYFKD
jgi:hypothetical protein